MLPNSSAIKREAKKMLTGKWPLGIAAVFVLFSYLMFMSVIYTLLYQFFSSGIPHTVLVFLVVFFITAIGFPLSLGILRIYRAILCEKGTDLYEVFYYFSSIKRLAKALQLCFFIVSKLALIGFLLFLPSLIVNLLSEGKLPVFESGMPIWFSNLWVFGTFLRGIAVAILIYIALRHYACAYIFIQNDNISALEAVLLSTKVSKVSISNFLGLCVSFLGWLALSLLAVPIFFTVPYFLMAYTIHCTAAINYYNRTIKSPTPFSDEMDFDL